MAFERSSFAPAEQLVLLLAKSGEFEDRASEIVSMERAPHGWKVRFRGTRMPFTYGLDKVVIAQPDSVEEVDASVRLEVAGAVWENATRLERFHTSVGTWVRIHYESASGPAFRSCPAHRVRRLTSANTTPRAQHLMSYFDQVVKSLPAEDPLRTSYRRLSFIHPESALAAYLSGATAPRTREPAQLIFPFAGNASQRTAIRRALTHQISVIEGPPGTGKTQTILNLIANIILEPSATVGVVSFNNAAVDNVYDKLADAGLGFVAAPLGNQERRARFFETQEQRLAARGAFLSSPEPAFGDVPLHQLATRIGEVYRSERELGLARAMLREVERERDDFAARRSSPTGGSSLPGSSARWPSSRFLELLAEAELQREAGTASDLRWRLRRRFRYRLDRSVDITSIGFADDVRAAYFEQRIAELRRRIARIESRLGSPRLAEVRNQTQAASRAALEAALRERYASRDLRVYDPQTLWQERDAYAQDYPVVLSTCHSLPGNLGRGRLVDYLIIDESSQVNLAVAVLAMSAARRVVIVGDSRQLPHIAEDVGGIGPGAGYEAYDYQRESLLTSVMAVFGDAVPRTMLREHYRCDPRVIDFCNRKFYDGRLIPMVPAGDGEALALVRTAPGQHSRSLQGGGRINQREVDVVVSEVLPAMLASVPAEEVGVITPFREQADLIAQTVSGIEADTVHKFQGREKRAVVMSAVIDASHEESRLVDFVDDPRMINVAVSRAKEMFALVVNPSLPAGARHLRDLVEYIESRAPAAVRDSHIVSVFDVLYTEYAEALREVAARMRLDVEFQSEEAVRVVLEGLLGEEEFRDLRMHAQVFLQDLLPTGVPLAPEEAAFVRNRASVDFVVSNRTTERVLGVVEVDGFMYHHDNPEQLRRDAMKDAILGRCGIQVLRLATTGSGEVERVRRFLEGLG